MNWKDVKIRDVCLLAVDCVNKTAPVVDYPTPYKMIRTTNVRGGFVDTDNVRYVTEETFSKWTRRSRPIAGDVILTREAPLGDVGRLTVDDNIFLGQRLFQYRADPAKLHPNFLAFVLQSPLVQGRIQAKGLGATVQHAKVGDFEDLEIPLPPLKLQETIGNTLAAYNDLLANNKRRIELLEKSARLLFKEWFVHLRYPGHEHDKIVDGVPEGWSKSTIEDVCSTFIDGDWLETKDQGGDGFRILQISNIGGNSFVETSNHRYISEETFRRLNCTEVLPGDLLISRMPEPIGRAWLVTPQPWRMVTAVDGAIARADTSKVDPFYLLHHLNSPAHLARCAAGATGATRPRIAKRVMGALPILVPPNSLQLEFSEIASANNGLKERLIRQNMTLQRARDLLLPRLMDGRLSV